MSSTIRIRSIIKKLETLREDALSKVTERMA